MSKNEKTRERKHLNKTVDAFICWCVMTALGFGDCLLRKVYFALNVIYIGKAYRKFTYFSSHTLLFIVIPRSCAVSVDQKVWAPLCFGHKFFILCASFFYGVLPYFLCAVTVLTGLAVQYIIV